MKIRRKSGPSDQQQKNGPGIPARRAPQPTHEMNDLHLNSAGSQRIGNDRQASRSRILRCAHVFGPLEDGLHGKHISPLGLPYRSGCGYSSGATELRQCAAGQIERILDAAVGTCKALQNVNGPTLLALLEQNAGGFDDRARARVKCRRKGFFEKLVGEIVKPSVSCQCSRRHQGRGSARNRIEHFLDKARQIITAAKIAQDKSLSLPRIRPAGIRCQQWLNALWAAFNCPISCRRHPRRCNSLPRCRIGIGAHSKAASAAPRSPACRNCVICPLNAFRRRRACRRRSLATRQRNEVGLFKILPTSPLGRPAAAPVATSESTTATTQSLKQCRKLGAIELVVDPVCGWAGRSSRKQITPQ
jgi:hypothetical protein